MNRIRKFWQETKGQDLAKDHRPTEALAAFDEALRRYASDVLVQIGVPAVKPLTAALEDSDARKVTASVLVVTAPVSLMIANAQNVRTSGASVPAIVLTSARTTVWSRGSHGDPR